MFVYDILNVGESVAACYEMLNNLQVAMTFSVCFCLLTFVDLFTDSLLIQQWLARKINYEEYSAFLAFFYYSFFCI